MLTQVHAFRPKLMLMMGMKDEQELAIKIEKLCLDSEATNGVTADVAALKNQIENAATQLNNDHQS